MTACSGLADRALGAVDEVQRPALVEQRRGRRVQVLGPLALEQPPAKSDRVAVLVADREQDACPELVDDAATALARTRQTDLDEVVGVGVPLGLELPGHHVPAGRRPAELVRLDRLVREATTTQIRERRLTGLGAGQDGVVEGDRRVEHPAKPSLAGVLALGALVDLDAGLAGQRAQRFRERHPVALHDEAEDVAALAAAEAVPRLANGGDHERRRLLAVEGAQPLVRGARLLEGDALADDVDDRQLALDLGSDADRQTPLLTPAADQAMPFRSCPPTTRMVPDTPVGLSSLDKPYCRK